MESYAKTLPIPQLIEGLEKLFKRKVKEFYWRESSDSGQDEAILMFENDDGKYYIATFDTVTEEQSQFNTKQIDESQLIEPNN